MPGAFYTDPGVLALERERLFMREWICVGRQEEVAAPGDYMAVRICDEPMVRRPWQGWRDPCALQCLPPSRHGDGERARQ